MNWSFGHQVSSGDAANLQISESLAEVIEESGVFHGGFSWVFVEGLMLKGNPWKIFESFEDV